jgi:hypothetical protein
LQTQCPVPQAVSAAGMDSACEVVHASRATGQDDHLKALTGTTDVQGHSVRRGNS